MAVQVSYNAEFSHFPFCAHVITLLSLYLLVHHQALSFDGPSRSHQRGVGTGVFYGRKAARTRRHAEMEIVRVQTAVWCQTRLTLQWYNDELVVYRTTFQ